jgi:hypothetical protein
MPLPIWFMRQTATITVRQTSQETAGSWDQSTNTTLTVLCCLQPSSSNESAIYKRETGRTLYTLYLMPKTTSDVAIPASQLNHISKITIDSVDYQTDGEFLNLCSNDVVYQMNVFREV